jgi:hypothetical protein
LWENDFKFRREEEPEPQGGQKEFVRLKSEDIIYKLKIDDYIQEKYLLL